MNEPDAMPLSFKGDDDKHKRKVSNRCSEQSRLPLITISRKFHGFVTTRPALESESGGIAHDYETENAEENITAAAEGSFGNCFVVKHRLCPR
jgi:hypothetical protein